MYKSKYYSAFDHCCQTLYLPFCREYLNRRNSYYPWPKTHCDVLNSSLASKLKLINIIISLVNHESIYTSPDALFYFSSDLLNSYTIKQITLGCFLLNSMKDQHPHRYLSSFHHPVRIFARDCI